MNSSSTSYIRTYRYSNLLHFFFPDSDSTYIHTYEQLAMRSNAGGCTLQQALTPAATTVVKEAVTLARRRGHAQVTPLHVASTMLSSHSSSGLLRAACQQSNTHPLQCRALELCFNVALNRLPTTAASSSSSPPMLGPPSLYHHQPPQAPAISNALVAAFKRAQAHQRRGCGETQQQQQQQQPLLSVKIELEQLVVSILDDPSVSRVMKEAGFSSTLVKAKVQQAVASVEVFDSRNNNTTITRDPKSSSTANHNNKKKKPNNNHNKNSLLSSDEGQVTMNEDYALMSVIEGLVAVRKRKRPSSSCCVVVVGECLAVSERAVEGAISKVERGDGDVPEILREVRFLPIHLNTIEQLSKEGVEKKVEEIKSIVKSSHVEKGVVFYLSDLDRWTSCCFTKLRQVGYYYCPVGHMIMEMKKLVLEYDCNDDDCGLRLLWLLGVATTTTTFQKSSQSGQAANTDHLEALWGIIPLHAITIPAGSLGSSLIIPDSGLQCSSPSNGGVQQASTNLLVHEGIKDDKTQKNPKASRDCNSELGASSGNSSLPSWLQKCIIKDYHHHHQQEETTTTGVSYGPMSFHCSSSSDTSLCNSPLTSRRPQRTLSLTSSTYHPPSGTSVSYGLMSFQRPTHQHHEPAVPYRGSFWFSDQQYCNKQCRDTCQTYIAAEPKDQNRSPLSPISNYSTSSSEILEVADTSTPRSFKEYTADNLRTICSALERKVPWQMDVIPDIASTILHCRGGGTRVRRRRPAVLDNNQTTPDAETWLFFLGADVDGKQHTARELAGLIFGSRDKFVSIGLSTFSSSPTAAADSRNKRSRDERSCSYLDRLSEAVSADSHRVFFLEDIEQADYCSRLGIKRAAERGKVKRSSNGEEVGFGDAIIILSCERFGSKSSRGCSPNNMNHLLDHHGEPIIQNQKKKNTTVEGLTSPSVSLDLNLSIGDDYSGNSAVQCDDDDDDDDCHGLSSIDETGLVASVDKCVLFKLHEL